MKTLLVIFSLLPVFGLAQVVIPTVSSTNTITNKSMSGSTNTFSNITQSAVTSLTTDLASARVLDVQAFAPATGATIKPTNNGRHILAAINPAATIATLTFNFPDAPTTGQTVTLSSSQIITAITLGNGTILNAISSLALGGCASYTYDGTQWRRVQ